MFAIVCIDCHNANGDYWKKNKKLLQTVRDKLEKTSPQWPEFVATAEDPTTVKTMLDLEQKMGREIKFVRGISFDQLIYWKKALPNLSMRWCTEYMKIIPMFEYIYKYYDLPVEMRIGFRYDEKHRANDLKANISFPESCRLTSGRQIWRHDFEYRKLTYPLIEDRVMHPMVKDYWKRNTDVTFPEDTGCQMCFWKDPQQIKLNSDRKTSRPVVLWANVMEHIMSRRFKKEISMQATLDIAIQMDFFGGTGPGCQAGICGI